MGWLPFSAGASDDGGVKKTSGGAFESPSRSNRKQCYAARDAFFECLDKNNVLDSINTKKGREKATGFCGQLDEEFEKNCAHSWVGETEIQGVRRIQLLDFEAVFRSREECSHGVHGKDSMQRWIREMHANSPQVEYFKKQRVVNYQREQTIKKIESQGGEIVAPQLPMPNSK